MVFLFDPHSQILRNLNRIFQLMNRAPCAVLNTTLCYFVPEYFTVSFLLFCLFYFNKMKIELGSKLCEPLLSIFAEIFTGCMHPSRSLFVNFSSLIAAMEMWSKIMIFSCDKWSSQGRNQHMFLILLFWGKMWKIHIGMLPFILAAADEVGFFYQFPYMTGSWRSNKAGRFQFKELQNFQSNRATRY